eukprot:TRINITY_DN66989_c9_g3_i1.p2 TRINITY_DN66989_c9_g3~~TRINITY_DN66989_c9_g3_i1.p2  ORF type:complete len:494 (+),score=75.76 TRINITY_DN66989_c9_g3_i1:48-1529(+)
MRRTAFEGFGEFLLGAEGCHKIPLSMYKNNRARVVERANKAGLKSGVLLHQGGSEVNLYDTDTMTRVFRNESYFLYLFGVQEPDFYGAIDLSTGKTTLFCPRLPEAYATWLGEVNPPEFYTKKYGVDETLFSDELAKTLKERNTEAIYVLEGENTDSGAKCKPASFDGDADFKVDKAAIFPVVAESRVFKSEDELNILRYANYGSSLAHVKAMQGAKPGIGEHQLESLLLHEAYFGHGLRHLGYTAIVGSGYDTAVLHYQPNNKKTTDGALVLIDMGAEYEGYTADITTTWPVNGKFTQQQKDIYNIVLAANRNVLNAVKPGIDWKEMHRLAYKTLAEGLVKLGILKGTPEELIENDIVYLFMPHGLGHFLGMAVHDVGGYLPHTPKRDEKPGFRNLRQGRVLEKGMVTTCEPGCYFNQFLFNKALADPEKAKFFDEATLKQYYEFGGVRIEENIVITEDGCENMTSVPRSVEEIEAVMAGGAWEPKSTVYKN